jgi:hypothetical protein
MIWENWLVAAMVAITFGFMTLSVYVVRTMQGKSAKHIRGILLAVGSFVATVATVVLALVKVSA